jgi:hypothetical protein
MVPSVGELEGQNVGHKKRPGQRSDRDQNPAREVSSDTAIAQIKRCHDDEGYEGDC